MSLVMVGAAAIAVIAGLLILRSVTDEGAEPVDADATALTTTTATTPISLVGLTPVATTVPTSQAPTAAKTDAAVMVVNASGVGGSASKMATELAADGYTTGPVGNAPGQRAQQSIIYYVDGDPTALAVARLLAAEIPSAQTLPMPDPPPIDRPLNGATVVLMLGRDAAGHRLSDLSAG